MKCKKCGLTRPQQDFYKNAGRTCKLCSSAEAKQWYRVNRGPKLRLQEVKRRARRKRLTYALPERLGLDLLTDACFYCGTLSQPLNGIDRVDNTKGYVEDNVVSCCKYCNAAKLARTKADFETWAMALGNRLTAFQESGIL